MMLKDGYSNISPLEWKVLVNASSSIKISEISRKARIPYSSTRVVLDRLRRRAWIHFIPSFEKIGLTALVHIHEGFLREDSLPTYAVSLAHVYGERAYTFITALVPEVYSNNYVRLLERDPLVLTKGTDLYWYPDSSLISYNSKLRSILCTSSLDDIYRKVLANWDNKENEDEKKSPKLKIDKIDVAIISEKLKYAFTKVSEIAKKFNNTNMSKQLLSYHFRRKVLKIWRYNSVIMHRYMKYYPYKVILFEGYDSKFLAKAIHYLPGFHSAVIGDEIAIVTGQPDDNVISRIYKFVYREKIDVKVNTLTILDNKIRRFNFELSNHFDGSWKKPEVEDKKYSAKVTSMIKVSPLPL